MCNWSVITQEKIHQGIFSLNVIPVFLFPVNILKLKYNPEENM